MSWASVTPSTVTYSAVGATDKTWTGSSVSVVPPAWTMARPIDDDGGTDFVVTLSNQFPWYLTEDRPIVLRDTYTDI